MKFIVLPLGLVLLCFTVGRAQTTTYSESKAYQPREIPEEKKTKKKKDKEQSTANGLVVSPGPSASLSGTRVITLPVSVFDDKGQFYKGLTQSDFAVFVDDKEVQISSFNERPQPTTIILVLDTSPSIYRLETVQKFAKEVLAELGPDLNVAVVEFNSSMHVLCDVTANRAEAEAGIDKAKVGDGTSLYKAMEVLFGQIGTKLPGRKVAVLLTDGVDTTSTSSSYSSSLLDAEKSDLIVYSVYLDTESGTWPKGSVQSLGIILGSTVLGRKPLDNAKEYERGRQYLTDLTGLSGGRLIKADKLGSRIAKLGEALKLQYFLTFSLPSSSIEPRKSVRVRVKKPGLMVLTRAIIW